MKKIVLSIIMIGMLSLFTGCEALPELDENAIAFTHSVAEYKGDEGYLKGLQTIKYNEREYGPFGTVEDMAKISELEKCVGYIDQEINSPGEGASTSERIYTIANDPNQNFLVEYNNSSSNSKVSVLRAIDTNGKEIDIPSYIINSGYDYWK